MSQNPFIDSCNSNFVKGTKFLNFGDKKDMKINPRFNHIQKFPVVYSSTSMEGSIRRILDSKATEYDEGIGKYLKCIDFY